MMKKASNMFKGVMEDGPGNVDAAFIDIWVFSRAVCTSVIEHLRSLLSIYCQTNYQHAKISESILKRDNLDMRIIEEFVDDRDIFEGDL